MTGGAPVALSVRIERLQPMRVAWVRAVSRTPERDAWSRLREWAEGAGLLEHAERHPVFGFNNPPPSPDSPEYGYELWIAVDPTFEPPEAEGIGVKEFPGGLYAVTTCRLRGGVGVLETWKALLRWAHSSRYGWRRSAHELERVHDPRATEKEMVLDLYLPLEG